MEFRGWPTDAIDFYTQLEADNSRAFWQAHKDVYEDAVRDPFLALSDAVGQEFGPLRLFRPYRDVRFSKDKSPYKTAAGAVTESEGGGAYYVQISAEGLFVGSGYYGLASDQLERYRDAVDHDTSGPQLVAEVEALRKLRYDVGARESLKTAPRGYPRDHPRVDLLRMKGIHVGKQFAPARWLHTRQALDRILGVWRGTADINRWLDRHVGPSTLPPPEPD